MKRIEIKYQIDNDNWTDDEFDEFTDRSLNINMNDFRDILLQRGLINKDETIHDIQSVELKYR